MSGDDDELRRWSDGGGPAGMRELLRAGRESGPDPSMVERVGASLESARAAADARSQSSLLAGVAGTAVVAGLALWYFLGSKEPSRAVEAASPPPMKSIQTPAPDAVAPTEPLPREATPEDSSPEKAPTTANTKARAPAELELLRAARSALERSPKGALGFLETHARLYPKGVLSEERDALRLEALRKLGRLSEADRETLRFSEDYPDSAHAPRPATTNTPR